MGPFKFLVTSRSVCLLLVYNLHIQSQFCRHLNRGTSLDAWVSEWVCVTVCVSYLLCICSTLDKDKIVKGELLFPLLIAALWNRKTGSDQKGLWLCSSDFWNIRPQLPRVKQGLSMVSGSPLKNLCNKIFSLFQAKVFN